MVLYGHRSIVNQVRYNSQKCLIASSGVEKIIKLWRPFELEGWNGGLEEEPNGPTNAREIFSHEEYMSLFNVSGQNMTHDYSDQNTTEDPRMMAFFDSLVQREIEGWNSDDDNSSDSDKSSFHSSDGSSRPTSTLQSESDSTTSFQIYGRGKNTLSAINSYNGINYFLGVEFPNRFISTKSHSVEVSLEIFESYRVLDRNQTEYIEASRTQGLGAHKTTSEISEKCESKIAATICSSWNTKIDRQTNASECKRNSNQRLFRSNFYNIRAYRERVIEPETAMGTTAMSIFQKILQNVVFSSTQMHHHIEAIAASQKCNIMPITVIYSTLFPKT